MRRRDQLIIYTVSLFILIGLLFTNQLLATDMIIYNFISHFIAPNITKFFVVITELGDYIGVFMAVIIILIYNHKHNTKRNISLILILVFCSLYVLITKNVFQRPRPDILQLIDIDGFSFPSGHSTFSMAIYGYLIYLVNKDNNCWFKYIVTALLVILIICIGLSRIYLGVHYFSDVLAGFISGLIILNLVLVMEKRLVIRGDN